MASSQIDEFLSTFDILDHLPNQSSGFSATLLKNKSTGEYTLAFRSTEYRDITNGGDAERDAIRGAAGDIAFNGIAYAQLSSLEKYWRALLDGTRASGATPDDPTPRATPNLRVAELLEFKRAVLESGARINVSGYSLGGHLATMFSVLHGERVASLYLFNSAGVGRVRESFAGTPYQNFLASYEFYMRSENRALAYAEARAWAARAETDPRLREGINIRSLLIPPVGNQFLPEALKSVVIAGDMTPTGIVRRLIDRAEAQLGSGVPLGADKVPISASSALHFLVSLFVSEGLEGTFGQTVGRAEGNSYASLRELGLIDPGVRIYQVSGLASQGAPSIADFRQMRASTDWNIVADSGIRAAPDSELISVYIENQPTATGWPFNDRGWGDFGNTHSITLIVDSLAVTRMLQKAHPELTQAAAEQIMQAASSLRKEAYSFFPSNGLAEHDTLERVVDAFGRVLFGRKVAAGIDWSRNLASSNGVTAFGELAYRDPLHARIRVIEIALDARAAAGPLHITSLASWSVTDLVTAAHADGGHGLAMRYALKESNPFLVEGAGLYDDPNSQATLALHDPASAVGGITDRWIEDRSQFLALKVRLGLGDRSYEAGAISTLYASTATGERAFVLSPAGASAFAAPDTAKSLRQRPLIEFTLENAARRGDAVKVIFGADGDPFANPSSVEGGHDTLRGGAGADRLYGEGGNDLLYAGAGADYVEGGRGDDTLSGNADNDTLAGGSGFDVYLWNAGDGTDRIVDAREPAGEARGRIVIRTGSSLLVPQQFKRDRDAAGELWRSPDRTLVLTHTANWTLAFAGGELDLGTDLRDGDLGMRIEGATPPRAPTVIGGALADSDVIGPNVGSAAVVGDYGHDRLFSTGIVPLEAFLLLADEPSVAGRGRWLSAGPGDDLAIGTAASDVLMGGGGADTLAAGPGDDLVNGDLDSTPILNGHELAWDYRPSAADVYDTEFHAAGFETGSTVLLNDLYREQTVDGADVIHAGGGNDRIYGRGGDDLVYGDQGDDLIVGGEGADALFGAEGNDRITGEQHGYASRAFDVIGASIVSYPQYVASYGNDVIDGGAGNDELTGEGGNDVLFGGDGADALFGDIAGLPGLLHGADVLDGGDGNDVVAGQGAGDVLFGGAGNDTLLGDSDAEAAFHGADVLDGEDGNDVLIGAGGADELLGGPGNDTLAGDALDLALERHGADVLDGGDGDDVLYGLGGEDQLFGGAGEDRLYGDDADSPASGDADLLDGGAGNDMLRGQGGEDRLQGGEGADTLFGETGNDTLAGGPGPDALDGGAGDDVYEFFAGDGADRIVDSAGLVTLAFVDGVELTDLRAARVAGTGAGVAPLAIDYGAGDVLSIEGLLDAGRLRIQIGDGVLLGGAELEALTQAGALTQVGGAGSEALAAAGAGAHLFAFNGDDLLIGSEAADRLHGGAGDDELLGLGGNDTLIGGADADRLAGGTGDDRLEGGAGDDTYVFVAGSGIDRAVELAGEGVDAIELSPGMAADAVRLRRSGNDLVVAERGGGTRLYANGWFAFGREADPGIDAITHDNGSLDAAAIAARVIADRVLTGSDGADVLTGDEFDDIIRGGRGDDELAGLAGNDRYVYQRGDGGDRIDDTGGVDALSFGPGIEAGEIDLVGTVGAGGVLTVRLTLAGESGEIRFDEASERRVEEFQFDDGAVYTFGEMVARVGGLRQQGSDADDTLIGGFYADALYGFGGEDTLLGDAGSDLLVGAEGADLLAGGPNSDVYVFNLGDGRDALLEYAGMDEYRLFRSYFTPAGHRAIQVDGVVFEAQGMVPGPMDETFNITLGTVSGGEDTIVFGEGVAPTDIRFGLDRSLPNVGYPTLVPNGSGGYTPGVATTEQIGYVLEVGGSGDAIELVWPNVESGIHQAGAEFASAPLERLEFGEAEAWTLQELFAIAGGWDYVIGTPGADRMTGENVIFGGVLAGGAGDDTYVEAEAMQFGLVEHAAGGIDTIVFGEGVSNASLGLVFDQNALRLTTPRGDVRFDGISPGAGETPQFETLKFSDGSEVEFRALLERGVAVPGTPYNDSLLGTALDDRIDGGGGNDFLAGGGGSDRLMGVAGSDRYYFALEHGQDTIDETDSTTDTDVVEFAPGIAPAAVSARRHGGNIVLDLPGSSMGVTIEGWFDASPRRIEAFVFADGTHWDAAQVSELADRTPVHIGSTPFDPIPTSETAPTAPDLVPSVTPSLPDPGPDIVPSPLDAAPRVVPSAAPDVSAAPATPAAMNAPMPPAAKGNEQAPEEAGITPEPTRPATPIGADSGATGGASPIAAAPVTEPAASVSGTVSAPAGTLDTLSLGGFVSPGRAEMTAIAESATDAAPPEIVSPPAELPTAETPAADAPGATTSAEPVPVRSFAAYWRWMHAALDAHLERGDPDDLGAPPYLAHRALGIAASDPLQALAPSTAIGLRDRGAFEARSFSGLSDGIARLG